MGVHDCVMTVKGNGRGSYGNFKEDETRTVWDFIVDNGVIYPKVLKHVRECEAAVPCDPAVVLGRYLERRKTLKQFNGSTSAQLVELALKYRRAFGDRVPKRTVSEIIARSMNFATLLCHSDVLEMDGVVDGIHLAAEHYRKTGRAPSITLNAEYEKHPLFPLVKYAHANIGNLPEDRDQLMRLATVYEVMGT